MTPATIIAAEVGPLKAHTILAALRAQGWVVERQEKTSIDLARLYAGGGNPPPVKSISRTNQ
jgi:hypothetical protein